MPEKLFLSILHWGRSTWTRTLSVVVFALGHVFLTGILEVLYCVLIESPEVLNIIQENHIKSIISLLDKHGRNHKVRNSKHCACWGKKNPKKTDYSLLFKAPPPSCHQVLDVLCSLCVCNGVAVRSNQNLITENLLPGRDLLLQTNIINYVTRWGTVSHRPDMLCASSLLRFYSVILSMRPNIFLGTCEGSTQYKKWYFEVMVDHVEPFITAQPYHLRVGWALTEGYSPYPGGGEGWGGNGVGDDLYSYGFDGLHLWSGKELIVWLKGCLLQAFDPNQQPWNLESRAEEMYQCISFHVFQYGSCLLV